MLTTAYLSDWEGNSGFPRQPFRIRSMIDFAKIFCPQMNPGEVRGAIRRFGFSERRLKVTIPGLKDGLSFGSVVTIHDPSPAELWSLDRFWVDAETVGRAEPRFIELEVALDFRPTSADGSIEELLAWQRFHLHPYQQHRAFCQARASDGPGKRREPFRPVGSWQEIETQEPARMGETLYLGPQRAHASSRIGFLRSYLKTTEFRKGKLVTLPGSRHSARLEVRLQSAGLIDAGLERPSSVRRGSIRKALFPYLTMSRPLGIRKPLAVHNPALEVAVKWLDRRWKRFVPHGAAALGLAGFDRKLGLPRFVSANERIGDALANLERRFS